MKSFHSDPAVKEKYVGRVMAHAKADQLVQGTGWEGGQGCAEWAAHLKPTTIRAIQSSLACLNGWRKGRKA